MFRKTTLLVAALALMLVVPQAHAAKGAWVIDFNGGTAMPMGDYKDVAKLGFMGGVGVGYGVTEAVVIGADGSFVMNDGSDELNAFLTDVATTIEGTPTTVTGKTSMIQGGAHLKYMFPMGAESKIGPYAVVGLGIYNLKAKTESDNPTYEGEESESKFGGRGGLGFSYKASENVGVGVEGTFHVISTEGSKTTFVGLQAGVTVGMSQAK
jgi:opacity protein-like surface antigen